MLFIVCLSLVCRSLAFFHHHHHTNNPDATHIPASSQPVPKERDSENVVIENASVHSTPPSPSETRNPSRVDLQDGEEGTTERKKDLEKGRM